MSSMKSSCDEFVFLSQFATSGFMSVGRSSGAPVPSHLTNEQSVATSILVVSVSEMSKSHLFLLFIC